MRKQDIFFAISAISIQLSGCEQKKINFDVGEKPQKKEKLHPLVRQFTEINDTMAVYCDSVECDTIYNKLVLE